MPPKPNNKNSKNAAGNSRNETNNSGTRKGLRSQSPKKNNNKGKGRKAKKTTKKLAKEAIGQNTNLEGEASNVGVEEQSLDQCLERSIDELLGNDSVLDLEPLMVDDANSNGAKALPKKENDEGLAVGDANSNGAKALQKKKGDEGLMVGPAEISPDVQQRLAFSKLKDCENYYEAPLSEDINRWEAFDIFTHDDGDRLQGSNDLLINCLLLLSLPIICNVINLCSAFTKKGVPFYARVSDFITTFKRECSDENGFIKQILECSDNDLNRIIFNNLFKIWNFNKDNKLHKLLKDTGLPLKVKVNSIEGIATFSFLNAHIWPSKRNKKANNGIQFVLFCGAYFFSTNKTVLRRIFKDISDMCAKEDLTKFNLLDCFKLNPEEYNRYKKIYKAAHYYYNRGTMYNDGLKALLQKMKEYHFKTLIHKSNVVKGKEPLWYTCNMVYLSAVLRDHFNACCNVMPNDDISIYSKFQRDVCQQDQEVQEGKKDNQGNNIGIGNIVYFITGYTPALKPTKFWCSRQTFESSLARIAFCLYTYMTEKGKQISEQVLSNEPCVTGLFYRGGFQALYKAKKSKNEEAVNKCIENINREYDFLLSIYSSEAKAPLKGLFKDPKDERTLIAKENLFASLEELLLNIDPRYSYEADNYGNYGRCFELLKDHYRQAIEFACKPHAVGSTKQQELQCISPQQVQNFGIRVNNEKLFKQKQKKRKMPQQSNNKIIKKSKAAVPDRLDEMF